MKLIGIDLYQHLLAGAIRASRGEDTDRWSPELNLGTSAALPEEWIPEPEVRVTLYARLARIADADALEAFELELEDRFGALPEAAGTLIAIARVRLMAIAAGIARIDAGPGAIAFTARRGFEGDAAAAGLEESNGRLLLREKIEDPGERLARVEAVLEILAG
jgi:transcription-repair coupling factor (superfamily II helicase)